MSHLCKICTNNFLNSPDSVIVCEHLEGVVHLGCCVNRCSYDKKPCKHSHGCFDKI